MDVSTRLNVSPAILHWMRASVGATEEEAAKRAGTSLRQYQRIENGELAPTVRQLRQLARAYRKPFGLFLKSDPPELTAPLPHDFRGFAGEILPREDTTIAIQLDVAERRRELALQLYEELGEEIPRFELQLEISSEIERSGEAVREALGLDSKLQAQWRNGERALSALKGMVEDKGILVGQFSRVDIEHARGLSISEFPLPIIILNPRDPAVARVFSLLHEVVHITLRASGVCNIVEEYARPPEEQKMEVFCNAVAGSALVPETALLAHPLVARHDDNRWPDELLIQIKRDFGVSKFVILRRLLVLGRTTQAFYDDTHKRWLAEHVEEAPKKEGFVPPYRQAMSAAGRSFSRLVVRALHENVITLSDASDFLRTRARNVETIANEVF